MREEVIKELELITDEEKRVLSGEKQKVVWDIYSSEDKFEVDAKRLIRQGEYLSVRKHCRFIDFRNMDIIILRFYTSVRGRSQTGSKGNGLSWK